MAVPEYVTRLSQDVWTLKVWVQPGASRSGFAGTYQGRLKVKLSAPAVDGKANKALGEYMASRLGLKPRQVVLETGQTSRAKTLKIESGKEPDWNRVFQEDE